ncbi:hypothetical protein HanIR_Chr04g0203611 [Helianthus annuus]|nr:hypothetical protein HanIR_Chr04g0203611 [Helianthus annuus]
MTCQFKKKKTSKCCYHVISTKVLYPKNPNFFFSLLSRNPVPFPSLVSDRRPELEFRRSPTPLFSDQHLFSLTSSLSLLNYGRPPLIGGDIRQAAATPPPQAVALWWLTWRRQQRQRGVVDALKEAMAWTPAPAVTNQNSDNSHTLLILLIFLFH